MKILVTGGTNGMGKGVAQILAGMEPQHEVIILGRSAERGAAVVEELKRETGNRQITLVVCDLARLAEVREASRELHARHEFLDGVFINAGLGYAARRVETAEGLDSHFQVNYLSQFMLTLNLLDLLEKSGPGGRVVFNVTRGGRIHWDDLQLQRRWDYETGIHQAMVAKRMLCVSLHERYRKKAGRPVAFIGFQIPKTVWSNQVNIIPAPMRAMAGVMKFFGGFISLEKCGRIMAPLFTEPGAESLRKSGRFITWKGKRFVELREDPGVLDPEAREKLWKLSLELCGDETASTIAGQWQGEPSA